MQFDDVRDRGEVKKFVDDEKKTWKWKLKKTKSE